MFQIALEIMIVIAGPPTATVDLVEMNHCYDDSNRLRFVQVIYWDDGHVREWHMIDVIETVYSHQCGFKVIRKIGGRIQVVWGRAGKTTWTHADPEEQDRQWVPVQNRVGLFGE